MNRIYCPSDQREKSHRKNTIYFGDSNVYTAGDCWINYGTGTFQSVVIGELFNNDDFALTNVVSQTNALYISVEDWNKPRISTDNGDASITIAVGDEQVQMFETELTAVRTVTLPEHEANPSNVFEGLTYKIVRHLL